MASFSDIAFEDIKTDCRYYSGYKPCGKADGCVECPQFQPKGEQVLVIKLGAMGDVLRCKVILEGLKKEHPSSWIVWLTAPGSESLVRDDRVDEILTLSTEGLLRLEGRRFARLICLDKDPHAVALAGKIQADKKQGFAPTDSNTITVWNEAAMYALRLGLSDPLKFYENQKSMPEIVSEVCELPYTGHRYTLDISDQARGVADARWTEIFGAYPPAGKKIVGFNTGCGPVFATKGWTRERMVGFLKLAGESEGVVVVLLGGPRERELHDFLLKEVGELAGKTVFDAGTENPLEVFFGLVDHCDAVLTADSLALHIAVALDKPVIAWFGSTCHQEIDLYGKGEKLVTDFPCSPCYLKKCPKPEFCLDAMTEQDVFTALCRVLGKGGHG